MWSRKNKTRRTKKREVERVEKTERIERVRDSAIGNCSRRVFFLMKWADLRTRRQKIDTTPEDRVKMKSWNTFSQGQQNPFSYESRVLTQQERNILLPVHISFFLSVSNCSKDGKHNKINNNNHLQHHTRQRIQPPLQLHALLCMCFFPRWLQRGWLPKRSWTQHAAWIQHLATAFLSLVFSFFYSLSIPFDASHKQNVRWRKTWYGCGWCR